MRAELVGGNVRANCPSCRGAVTTFEDRSQQREFGSVILDWAHSFGGRSYTGIVYTLLRCAGCGRGGLASIRVVEHKSAIRTLADFYPVSIDLSPLPALAPEGIRREFREAELCSAHRANRAASALLRSTLEKTLRANGFEQGGLRARIDSAADIGVITNARRRRAHDDIRVLGNDVLHDDWREVDDDAVSVARHYVLRIIEDFYDDRPSVETILVTAGKIEAPPADEHE